MSVLVKQYATTRNSMHQEQQQDATLTEQELVDLRIWMQLRKFL